MIRNIKLFYFISIIFLSITSCANLKIVPHDNEEIFLLKAETRLIDLNNNTLIKKFVSFDNIEKNAKENSLNNCNNYLKKINKNKTKFKFFRSDFTEYGKRVIEF